MRASEGGAYGERFRVFTGGVLAAGGGPAAGQRALDQAVLRSGGSGGGDVFCLEAAAGSGWRRRGRRGPPYGINYDTNPHGTKGRCRNVYKKVRGDDRVFDPSHLLAYKNVVLWGANYYAHRLPRSTKWIVWDKRQGKGQNCQSDCELAWTQGLPGVSTHAFYHYWNGAVRASEQGDPRVHPTQKPIALMRWCVSLFPGVRTLVDPYMGAGTTLVAAKQLGLSAIGIEWDEYYCRQAVARLEATTRLLN